MVSVLPSGGGRPGQGPPGGGALPALRSPQVCPPRPGNVDSADHVRGDDHSSHIGTELKPESSKRILRAQQVFRNFDIDKEMEE